MQESKAELLRQQIEDLKKNTEAKLAAQTRLLNSSLVVLKDYDAKINTLLDLCVKAGVFDRGQFDMLCDVRRGLRLMTDEEPIAKGDVVWINFIASLTNEDGTKTVVGDQKGMPIRMGAGAWVYEEDILGKHVGEKFQKIGEPIEDPGPNKGKQFVFDIEIVKAKTKLMEVADDTSAESTDGVGTSAGDQGQGQPNPELNGHGHDQPSQSVDQPVLQ